MEHDTEDAAVRVTPEPASTGHQYTVREFLDASLDPHRRTVDLQGLAARFIGQPLDDTVHDLRTVIAAHVGMEDLWRLTILISQLRACGAKSEQIAALHAELADVRTQNTTAPERGGNHVLSD